MNKNVRSWSYNHRNSRPAPLVKSLLSGRGSSRAGSPLARLAKSLRLLLAMAGASAATLQAQVVTTLISSNLFEPHSVATDGINAYVTDASNNRIVRFSLSTSNLATLAGISGLGGAGYINGIGIQAQFNQPLGIVYARGGLCVVDSGNQVIRFVTNITTTTNTVSLLAGLPGVTGTNNGTGTNAQFTFPTAITVDPAANLYVADTGNNSIRVIDTNNNVATVNVTNGYAFLNPEAVSLDAAGNLWVADTGHNSICVISNVFVLTNNSVQTSNRSVTLIANSTHTSGSRDDVLNAANATFNYPSGLFWSTNMKALLISDTGNDTIRLLVPTNALGANIPSTQTIAGSAGLSGNLDGPPLSALFASPAGIALDTHDGNNFYYVVDRASASNGTLRVLQPVVLASQIPGPPSISIANLTNNEVFILPTNILVTISYSDTNLGGAGYVTNVEIFTNGVPWQTNTTATSFNLSYPTNTTYTLLAVAMDNAGQTGTSAAVAITVILPQSPVIAIISPTNGSEYVEGQPGLSIPITATNLDPNTAVVPSAGITNVSFYANGTQIPLTNNPILGTIVNLSTKGSRTTATWSGPGTNQFSLTAVAIDSYGLSTTSAPVNIIVVGPQAPIVAITNPPGGTVYFFPTNVSIGVSAIDPNTNGLNAVGAISSVQLLSGGIPIWSGGEVGSNVIMSSGYAPDGQTFIWYNPPVGTNVLTAVATDTNYQIHTISAPVTIIVTAPPPPPPTFSPSSGYFPFCQTISITNVASNQPPNQNISIFYTTDGTTPTTSSSMVPNLSSNLMTNGSTTYLQWTGSIQWCNPLSDLTHLQMIAFNGVLASTVATGTSAPTNLLGFVQGATNGAGSTIVLPIVADLVSNGLLQSIQFRAEVTSTNSLIPTLALLPLTTNDFVGLVGPGAAGAAVTYQTFAYPTNYPPTTNYYTGATSNPYTNGQGLLISAAGSSSGFSVSGFAVIGLLAVQIPAGASNGLNQYQLSLIYPSGTSDAKQTQVGMTSTANQFISVETVPYFSGDSAPGNGYNAGQFGDGILNSADVNNTIYASFGIRQPYPFSDVYNAMDAYPETSTEIGDGFITYLDWQTILYRSEGLLTANWIRFWTNGVRTHSPVAYTPGLPVSLLTPDPVSPKGAGGKAPVPQAVTPPGWVWFRQASISAGTLTNVASGNSYSFPVYANVQPGYTLAGLQFRATLLANGGAPPPGPIQFTHAPGMAAETQLPALSSNDIICAWNLGAFAIPHGSTLLGSISFQVPAGAQPGQSYTLHFSGVGGGAADALENTNSNYQMESLPGTAWVYSAPLQPPQITSDEWRTNFFGSYTNAMAADNADPDGDGSLNWQEYVAGTNPTNALSYLQFSSINRGAAQAAPAVLSWLTAPGKTYLLEATPALGVQNWSVINTNIGNGNVYLFAPPPSGTASFYRICVQPQNGN